MDTHIACDDCAVGSCAIYTLTTDELDQMGSNKYLVQYKSGDLLRKQNTPMNFILFLRSGYVKEFLQHDHMPSQVIQLIKPGSYIGLHELSSESLSIFSYKAITDIDVCYIEKETFNNLIARNGNFAKEIIKAMSLEAIANNKRFLSLSQTQIFGKVAGLLIYLSVSIYENSNFELLLTRAELAQMIATSRESVTRTLKWFHNAGIISLDKQRLTILNEAKLSEFARRA
jgi:CRP-like cAMP-binding protein